MFSLSLCPLCPVGIIAETLTGWIGISNNNPAWDRCVGNRSCPYFLMGREGFFSDMFLLCYCKVGTHWHFSKRGPQHLLDGPRCQRGLLDSGCLVLWLSCLCSTHHQDSAFFPPLVQNRHGIHQECALYPSLDTWAPSGTVHGAHRPVSYVPTHVHAYLYAPFSKGESDSCLELQVTG